MSFQIPIATSRFTTPDGLVDKQWYLFLNQVQQMVGGVLAVTGGGTGLASGTSGGILGFIAPTTIQSSVALGINRLVLGGGAGATPTALGTLGTATTVLHGNAAGAPTFSAVALATDVSGTLQAAQFPALTGDVSTTAGSLTTAIGTNKVTNAQLAQMAANSVKLNNTGGAANAIDGTVAQAQTLLAIPPQTIGSWTPADNSGAGLVFASVSANYTQIGNMIYAYATWVYPVTVDGTAASITGLPVTVANANYAQVPSVVGVSAGLSTVLVPVKNTITAAFDVSTSLAQVTNVQLSGSTIKVMLIYPAT